MPTLEVINPIVKKITPNSVTISALVKSDSLSSVTVRGVVLAETESNNDPKIDHPGVRIQNATASVENGSFTVDITGLEPGKQYSFKAYADISKDPKYSDPCMFVATAIDNFWRSAIVVFSLLGCVVAIIALVAATAALPQITLAVLSALAVVATIAIVVGFMRKTWGTDSGPEFARGLITVLFTTGTMAIAFILIVAVVVNAFPGTEVRLFDKGKDVLAMLIGIFGTIMGFYFGTEKNTPKKPDVKEDQNSLK